MSDHDGLDEVITMRGMRSDVLARTRAFLTRTPALQEWLTLADLQLRPDVVLLLADHVRRKHIR